MAKYTLPSMVLVELNAKAFDPPGFRKSRVATLPSKIAFKAWSAPELMANCKTENANMSFGVTGNKSATNTSFLWALA